MINDRYFGSDIPLVVKNKLRSRQKLLSETLPLEELQKDGSFNLKNDFDGQADLSSRTPFARMWTAVQLVGAPKLKDTDNTSEEDKITELKTSSRTLGKKIYIVGTNNLSTIDSFSEETDELGGFLNNDEMLQYNLFPPEHGVTNDNNKFFKPQAGIISVSSETGGVVGEIKFTTVNFVIHNFHDYDAIYNKFFLKPGAKIFIDYGWNSLTEPLYNPYDLIDNNSKQVKQYLYGEISKDSDGVKEDGWVTKNAGDANTSIGIVNDYTSKILSNGSVECSLTIQGENQILSDQKVNNSDKEDNYKKFIKKIDEEILFEQVYTLSSEGTREKLNIGIANLSTGTTNINDFISLIRKTANTSFGGSTFTPTTAASLSGIYIKGNDTYMSWGLFEDSLLNNYFASGDDLEKINDDTSESAIIKFDSSNSWAVFKNTLFLRQADEITSPITLIPEQWDYSYNTKRDKTPLNGTERIEEQPEDLSEQIMKDTKEAFNKFFDKELNVFNTNRTFEGEGDYSESRETYFGSLNSGYMKITPYDWKQFRIPLREVFIHTDVIKEVFRDNEDKSVGDLINDLLNKINGEYKNTVWDWKLTGNSGDQLSIQDLNYSEETRKQYASTQKEENDEIANEFTSGTGKYGDIFQFNIMGNNSMVTSYDVTTSFPSDELANMLAMQAITTEDGKFYPPSKLVNRSSAIQTLLSTYTDDLDATSQVMFQYLPKQGPKKAEELAQENNNSSDSSQSYKNFKNAFESKTSKIDGIQYSGIDIALEENKEIKESFSSLTKEPVPDEKNNESNVEKSAIQEKINTGQLLHDSPDEYWKSILQANEYIDEENVNSMPMPINLTLSVYGIGTMQVGDIFTVDYLPQIYLQSVYFQTLKVTQNLDSTGWFTTLETQYRVKPSSVIDNNSSTGKPTKGHETVAGQTTDLENRKKSQNKKYAEDTFETTFSDSKYKSTNKNFLNPYVAFKDYIGKDRDSYKRWKGNIINCVFNNNIRKQTYVNKEIYGTKAEILNQFYTKKRDSNSKYDDNWPDGKQKSSRAQYFVDNIKDASGKSGKILCNLDLESLISYMTKLRTANHPTKEINIHVWKFMINTLGEDGKLIHKITPSQGYKKGEFNGVIWINNPVYHYWGKNWGGTSNPGYSEWKHYLLDGWGMGGVYNTYLNIDQTGHKSVFLSGTDGKFKRVVEAGKSSSREKLYNQFITNGYYKHGEECYLIIKKNNPKCWAVIPAKGNSLADIQKVYDLREIGASVNPIGGPFKTKYGFGDSL